MQSFTTQLEGKTPGDWLRSEANGNRSREQVTILAGSGSDRVLGSGTVLGKLTSGGKYVAQDPDASDGSEDAAGILLNGVTAPDGTDVEAAIIARDAEVNGAGLTWSEDTDLDQAAAIVQLEALGIQVREGV